MWTETEVEEAIADYPDVVGAAVAALNLVPDVPLVDLTIIRQAASQLEIPFDEFLVDWLKRKNLLEGFVGALQARGVPIDLDPLPLEFANIDQDELAKFSVASKAFGCRIRVGPNIVGSGVLVGPNTVLTASHVVDPNGTGGGGDDIQVVFADNKSIDAHPPALYDSPCGDREKQNLFPSSDDEVLDKHDVAVLRLASPAGALLGCARLPDAPASYVPNRAMMLVHYPAGTSHGLGVGSLQRVRNINARWSHTAATQGGSSGGGCFDSSLTLLGIHQGKDPRQRGRLVPLSQFYSQLRDIVANDQAPPRMWSLDGTDKGEFVIGRQALFEAYAAVRQNPRVRGIRIKRANAAGDLSGLPFSYRIIEQLVARTPNRRLIRISFEVITGDIADEIVRRASDAGIPLPQVSSEAGVADGQSAPEAVGADRGRRVAALLDAKAAELGFEVWVFIDHPAVTFGDAPRPALEGFVDAALRLDHLRLVLAGFEAVAMPGQDFYVSPDLNEQGARGLLNEILAGFQRNDVQLFLSDAAAAAGHPIGNELRDHLVDAALADLPNIGGIYEPWIAADVATRLRPQITQWFET